MRKAIFAAILALVCSLAAPQAEAESFTLTIPSAIPGGLLLITPDVSYPDSAGNLVEFSPAYTLQYNALFNAGAGENLNPIAVLSAEKQTIPDSTIQIVLPFDVVAFSLSYGTPAANSVTFLLSNGDSYTQASTGGPGWSASDSFSVGPTAPFNEVLITSPANVLNIANLSYSTPEPGTLSLLGTGLVMLGSFLRRKARA